MKTVQQQVKVKVKSMHLCRTMLQIPDESHIEYSTIWHKTGTGCYHWFLTPNDKEWEMKMERKVVWVQGFWNWNLAKRNILIVEVMYFIDVINIYLDAIVDYLGKNCALEKEILKNTMVT